MWGTIVGSVGGIIIAAIGGGQGSFFPTGASSSSISAMIAFGAFSCLFGVASVAFTIWAVVLIFLYRAAFRRAAVQARTIWASSTPPA